jgi:hypothetical protein
MHNFFFYTIIKMKSSTVIFADPNPSVSVSFYQIQHFPRGNWCGSCLLSWCGSVEYLKVHLHTTSYAFTHDEQYTKEVQLWDIAAPVQQHLRGTSIPTRYNYIYIPTGYKYTYEVLYTYKYRVRGKSTTTRYIYTRGCTGTLLEAPYKYHVRQYENTTPASTPMLYR